MTDKKLAKDVAVHLDKLQRRRRMLRRLFFLALFAALVAAVILYGTCGGGWGFGGKGKGDGDGSGSGSAQPLVSPTDAPPARCVVRITSTGITVDKQKVSKEQAVAACKTAPGTDIIVTGGARQGEIDEVRAAFADAKLEFTVIDKASGGSGSGSAR